MQIYEALNSTQKLHLPDRDTEADIQAQLFAKLRKDGFNVKVGVTWAISRKNSGCQFDLVIFKDKMASVIIEVKSPFEGPQTNLDESHQGLKYRSFGLPVVLFWDMKDYSALKEFLNNSETKEISEPKHGEEAVKNPEYLKRLHRALDIASMSAYDLGLAELEHDLEQKRDFIKGLMI